MEALARIAVLLLAVAVMLALVRGGWSGKGGLLDWLKAKFLGA